MREYTQSVTLSRDNGWVGSCWQTSVACLLEVDPDTLPAQANYDKRETGPDGRPGAWIKGPSYHNVLQAYLRTHHGLGYVELHQPEEVLSLIRVVDPGWHLMTGRTVRSDAMSGTRHVVVGRYGEVAWDPHPSRAGLLDDIRWAFLVPYARAWREFESRPGCVPEPCVCPTCIKEGPPCASEPSGNCSLLTTS